ncbi:unnamed protein product, partial [Ectocarpus sp. 12 AP-2014]
TPLRGGRYEVTAGIRTKGNKVFERDQVIFEYSHQSIRHLFRVGGVAVRPKIATVLLARLVIARGPDRRLVLASSLEGMLHRHVNRLGDIP